MAIRNKIRYFRKDVSRVIKVVCKLKNSIDIKIYVNGQSILFPNTMITSCPKSSSTISLFRENRNYDNTVTTVFLVRTFTYDVAWFASNRAIRSPAKSTTNPNSYQYYGGKDKCHNCQSVKLL